MDISRFKFNLGMIVKNYELGKAELSETLTRITQLAKEAEKDYKHARKLADGARSVVLEIMKDDSL